MNAYVMIFRQGSALSESELQRRGEETAAWARLQNDAGHKLVPHILAPDHVMCGRQRPSSTAESWPVTALLLLQARDLQEAACVAESHPGVRYGASVEVRPWAPPRPLTA